MSYLAPKVRCRDRSGYPCDEVVALNSPHCGNRAHFPGANGGAPITSRHSQAIPLSVNEDYDLVDDTPDLDPVTFDSRKVHITQQALESWGRHPAALQAKIRDALIRGGYWRSADGTHQLELGRHQMVLSEDGRRCESYARLPEPPAPTWGEPIDLDQPAWNADSVSIDPAAIRAFTGRHRVDEDTARRELAILIRDAAASGTRHRTNDGSHRLSHRGFTIVVSPDGTVVTGYQTSHLERTPSQVRDKVPSRFGHGRQRVVEAFASPSARDQAVGNPPRMTSIEIATVFDPDRVWITSAVVDHSLPDRDLVVDGIRDALRRAARGGQWVAGAAGRHNLHHRGRRWIISSDGTCVLSCRPPWPSGAQLGGADDQKARPHRPKQGRLRKERPCDICGRSSGGPVCAECDRRLRDQSGKTRSGPNRLFAVRSVVYGGLPSLGKRR